MTTPSPNPLAPTNPLSPSHPQLTQLTHLTRPLTLSSLPNPALMGIVNITPNSFSDTNRFLDPAAALAHARQLAADGAALLDLGAEASSFFRPGIEPVPPEEQIRRLLPLLEQLPPRSPESPPVSTQLSVLSISDSAILRTKDSGLRTPLVSIDTRSAEVARRCLAPTPSRGRAADLINDISAGTHDPAMFPTIAELGCPIILMHISPTFPDNPPADAPDILATVAAWLLRRVDAARAAGIRDDRILLDPGIGFGKTSRDNMRLALQFPALPNLPFPIVLGLSRKRFLTLLDDTRWLGFEPFRRALLPWLPAPDSEEPSSAGSSSSLIPHPSSFPPHARNLHTAVLTAYHAARPPRPHGLIHRVHNVALSAQALRVGSTFWRA